MNPFWDNGTIRLYNASSQDMSFLADGSVDWPIVGLLWYNTRHETP